MNPRPVVMAASLICGAGGKSFAYDAGNLRMDDVSDVARMVAIESLKASGCSADFFPEGANIRWQDDVQAETARRLGMPADREDQGERDHLILFAGVMEGLNSLVADQTFAVDHDTRTLTLVDCK